MEPSTIVGAVVGGFANVLLPGWLTTLALACLLAFMGGKLFFKGGDIRRREAEGLAKLQLELGSDRLDTPLLGSDAGDEDAGSDGAVEGAADGSCGSATTYASAGSGSVSAPSSQRGYLRRLLGPYRPELPLGPAFILVALLAGGLLGSRWALPG